MFILQHRGREACNPGKLLTPFVSLITSYGSTNDGRFRVQNYYVRRARKVAPATPLILSGNPLTFDHHPGANSRFRRQIDITSFRAAPASSDILTRWNKKRRNCSPLEDTRRPR